MSIDPKKGGKCWSCKYCEDIATQDDNPSGSYYRKCTKSGKQYIDTCSFYCSDYVWDGTHTENSSSSSTSSSQYSGSSSTSSSQCSSSSGSSSSQGSQKGGCLATLGACLAAIGAWILDKLAGLGGCLVTLLVIGAINAAVGGLIWLIFGVIMGN